MEFKILPPYVAPENREILEKAEKELATYFNSTLSRIEKRLYGDRGATTSMLAREPSKSDLISAQREFIEDPVLKLLVSRVAQIKTLVERPRMLVTNDTTISDT